MEKQNIHAKIIGTGSYLPEHEVDNDSLMKMLDVGKDGAWLEEAFGIRKRRLDFDVAIGKRVGELSNTDLAEQACRKALDEACISVSDVDQLILVTCTPDKIHFMADVIELHYRLGLGENIHIEQIDSGCAGLALAFDKVEAYVQSGKSKTTLVVASNLPSSFFVDWRRYTTQKAWFSAVVFGDGAGAIVLQATEGESGLLKIVCGIDGKHPLIDYPGGGALEPTLSSNANRHLFDMNAREVKEQFPIAMNRGLELLFGEPPYDFDRFKRIYLHQANLRVIEGFARMAEIPPEKVPNNVERYGNTSAASTLILLDEDRRGGKVESGNELLFLWVGAGMVYGGAVVKL